jgi:hypothetical protein
MCCCSGSLQEYAAGRLATAAIMQARVIAIALAYTGHGSCPAYKRNETFPATIVEKNSL